MADFRKMTEHFLRETWRDEDLRNGQGLNLISIE